MTDIYFSHRPIFVWEFIQPFLFLLSENSVLRYFTLLTVYQIGGLGLSNKLIFLEDFAPRFFSILKNISQTLSHSRREKNKHVSKKYVSLKKTHVVDISKKSYKIKFTNKNKNGLSIWIVH